MAFNLGLCLGSTVGCSKDLSGTYKADLIEVEGDVKLQKPSIINLARKDGDQYTITISGDSFIAKSECAIAVNKVGDVLYDEDTLGLSKCNSTELRLYLDVTVIRFETTDLRTEFELRGNMYTNPARTFAPIPYRLVTKEFDIER